MRCFLTKAKFNMKKFASNYHLSHWFSGQVSRLWFVGGGFESSWQLRRNVFSGFSWTSKVFYHLSNYIKHKFKGGKLSKKIFFLIFIQRLR